ncbi:hypothetical protein [Rhodococcus coprophilus]|uniref:hypothetical protein n=1 Tax=Rhodococcus coprophilus TaxID=38310 RepID=UPI003F4CED36
MLIEEFKPTAQSVIEFDGLAVQALGRLLRLKLREYSASRLEMIQLAASLSTWDSHGDDRAVVTVGIFGAAAQSR